MIEAELPWIEWSESFTATIRIHAIHESELEDNNSINESSAMIEAELLPFEWSDSICTTLRGQSIHASELEDDDSERETFWPSTFIRTTFVAVRAAMPAIPALTRRRQGQPSAERQLAERTGPIYQIPQNKMQMGYEHIHKIVTLGDSTVGKTELSFQFLPVQLLEKYDPSIDDSYRKKMVVDNICCEIEVLDTAGQEEYTALRDHWIRDGDAFILVYATTCRRSFTRIRRFHNQISTVKESGYLPLSHLYVPSPVILMGHIFAEGKDGDEDLQSMREVSVQEGAALARELGCSFMEVSTTGRGGEEVIHRLVRNLRAHQLRYFRG